MIRASACATRPLPLIAPAQAQMPNQQCIVVQPHYFCAPPGRRAPPMKPTQDTIGVNCTEQSTCEENMRNVRNFEAHGYGCRRYYLGPTRNGMPLTRVAARGAPNSDRSSRRSDPEEHRARSRAPRAQ